MFGCYRQYCALRSVRCLEFALLIVLSGGMVVSMFGFDGCGDLGLWFCDFGGYV